MTEDNRSLGAGVARDSLWNNCFIGDGVYQITVNSCSIKYIHVYKVIYSIYLKFVKFHNV